MKKLISQGLYSKFFAIYMMVSLILISFPQGVFAAGVSVNVTANGSTNLVLSGPTVPFTVDVTSSNAVSCQLTSPATSGIATSASMNINPGDSFYPTVGGSITFTVVCDDADGLGGTATASAVVSLPAIPAVVTADIKANGSDGPVNLNTGDTYTYSWSSSNATSCQMTSPITSGISTSGNSTPISSGDSFYPPAGGSITLTITCTNGTSNATDSVVINLAGGGGGPVVPTASLSASPSTVTANATATLSWSSTNAVSCSASWTASTATSGSQIVTVPSTTTYSITCTDGVTPVVAQTTITVSGGVGGGFCTLPTITSSLIASSTQNIAFSYIITTNSTSTPIFTADLTSLPTGLSFIPATGTISGTPTTVGVYNIALTATNPCGSDSQTLVLTVNTNGSGGGSGGGGTGGGGSGGGGGANGNGAAGGVVNNPPIGGGSRRTTIESTVPTDLECFYLRDYMRTDLNNDPMQVMRLQSFLKSFEGYDYVTVNGIFDQATFNAVSEFQTKYKDDILSPWGVSAPTGYVYILTLKKINELYCQRIIPINDVQSREIAAYRALIENLHNQGIQVQVNPNGSITIPEGTSTPVELPVVGEASPPKGQNLNNLAAAILAGPKSLENALEIIYQFLIILITLYILADLLVYVLYKQEGNVLKKIVIKWLAICLGLIVILAVAFMIQAWSIVLPIFVVLICSAVWVAFYKKHDSIKASIKSWKIVIQARTKSLLKQ